MLPGLALAGRDVLKLRNGKLLRDRPNIEVDIVTERYIDTDTSHREPYQSLLGLNTGEIRDGAIAELTSDGLRIIYFIIEHDIARGAQRNSEGSIAGKIIRFNRGWKQTNGKTVLF